MTEQKPESEFVFGLTSPLYVEALPERLTDALKQFQDLPIREFETYVIFKLSGNTLRDLFSAHWNARNQACGFLMAMLVWPESERNPAEWFRVLGILQREVQYMHTIAEYYNRVHAK